MADGPPDGAGALRRSRAGSGFTLIELLIVLVVFALIMTALTAGLRFGSRAWQAQERAAAGEDDIGAVQRFLRQLIASGQNFRGDDTSLEFVATLPRALALPGRFDIELTSAADRLLLRWRPHVKRAADAADETETELAKGVTDLAFGYYVLTPGQPPHWLAALADPNLPPHLISVELSLAGRNWPTLVVAPMIDVLPGQK